MANPQPHTVSKSATDRLQAARSVKDDAVLRELLWVAIAVRAGVWPAWRSLPRKPQQNFPELLHLETPAGRIVYRLASAELPLFADLELRENDGEECTGMDKLSRLQMLAEEGW